MCVSIFEQNEFAKRAKITVLVALALLFAVESVWTGSCRFLPPPPLDEPAKYWEGLERNSRQCEKLTLSRNLGICASV